MSMLEAPPAPAAAAPAAPAATQASAPPPPAPGTVPVSLAPPPGVPSAVRYPVEEREVSGEVKTRHYDAPDEADLDRPFLEALPADMVAGVSLPLTYRLASQAGYSGVTMRVASSAAARARAYTCVPFYKPLSRCVGGRR
ncbi:MAG TPA: hypothetical protein VF092_02800 [Longimicrobium sp.]